MDRIFEMYQNNQLMLVDDIINTFPFSIAIIDTNQIVQYINHKFKEYFRPQHKLIGEAFHLSHLNCDLIEEGASYSLLSVKHKDEIVVLHTKPLFNSTNHINGYLLLFQGYLEQQLAEDKFKQLANRDYLTKLSNRRGLYQYFDALAPHQTMHFLFLDIDNFKIVNDVYGHSSGDELLVMVSEKVTECSPNTFISRIGGDEFVMVLPGTMTEYEVTHIARKILRNISSSEYRKDILYTISISIGIVLDQVLDCKLDDILYKCDSAMYRAKKNGKNQYVVFNSMEQEVQERRTIEEEMHHALAHGEFIVYLQPKVNMLTSQLFGAEALVRWQHPKDGLRFPDKFIGIFENTGFIVDLDMYVFEEVCKLKSSWKEDVFRDIIISVNMSRLHFYREDFVEKIIAIAEKYHVKTNQIEIEITESIFLKNSTEILDKVCRLKKAGFFISVDDFGSGYSSLNMLKDIPADILKLDRGFLQLSEDDEKSKTVIKNVIIMGKDLKLDLIAEGVESLEQVLFLTSCGCSLAQGYFYSKPIPISDFESYAKEHIMLEEHFVKFSFRHNLWDDDHVYEGVYIGTEPQYHKGVIEGSGSIYLPGGDVYKEIIKLPNSVISSESYTISMWVKSETLTWWTSLLYAEFENGFVSLAPCAWEGTSVFRIKDGRDVNGWYDTTCCSLVPNEWVFLAITYDAKSEIARYYSSGYQAGYRQHVPTLRIAKHVLLGGDVFQKSFKGYVSELTIYDHVKSAHEILSLHNRYLDDPTFKSTSEDVK